MSDEHTPTRETPANEVHFGSPHAGVGAEQGAAQASGPQQVTQADFDRIRHKLGPDDTAKLMQILQQSQQARSFAPSALLIHAVGQLMLGPIGTPGGAPPDPKAIAEDYAQTVAGFLEVIEFDTAVGELIGQTGVGEEISPLGVVGLGAGIALGAGFLFRPPKPKKEKTDTPAPPAPTIDIQEANDG